MKISGIGAPVLPAPSTLSTPRGGRQGKRRYAEAIEGVDPIASGGPVVHGSLHLSPSRPSKAKLEAADVDLLVLRGGSGGLALSRYAGRAGPAPPAGRPTGPKTRA